jgi:hypothetical protein
VYLGGNAPQGVDMYDTAADRRENSSGRKVAAAFGLALLFALQFAHGHDLQAAQACTRLGDDAARLSCYDLAMGRLNPANAGDQARPAEHQASLPKTLSAQVRQVTLLPAGLYRLALDNGQVWDTTQADSALAFKANDKIIISRGVLGSHQISLAGHNTGVSATRKQ